MIGIARPGRGGLGVGGMKRRRDDDDGENPRKPNDGRSDKEPAMAIEVESNFRPAEILIIGHSFVRRLLQYVNRSFGQFNNMRIEYSVAHVSCYSVAGATVDDILYNHLNAIDQYRPDIVYIAMGTNDLAAQDADPHMVGMLLENMAQQLVNLNVNQVIVGETLFRTGRGIPSHAEDFNTRVIQMNHYLHNSMHNGTIPGAFHWHHIGLWNPQVQVLSRDGTHLNRVGQHRYYRSVRGALLHAISRARHNGHLN